MANGSTVAFSCNSPEQVRQFHDVAVANGGTSIEDLPGPRESAMGTIHLAYVRDPDGNKLCGIHIPGEVSVANSRWSCVPDIPTGGRSVTRPG